MNYLDRLSGAFDRINGNHSPRGKFTRPIGPPVLRPAERNQPDSGLPSDFVGADNRSNQTPGLRIVGTYLDDETDRNIWAVDNSSAAQDGRSSVPSQEDERKLGRSINQAMIMLKNSESCAEFITNNARDSSLGVNADPVGVLNNRNRVGDNGSLKLSDNYTFNDKGVTNAAAITTQYMNNEGKIVKTGDTQIGRIFFDDTKLQELWKMAPDVVRSMIMLHELKHALGGMHKNAKENTEWLNEITKKCLSLYK